MHFYTTLPLYTSTTNNLCKNTFITIVRQTRNDPGHVTALPAPLHWHDARPAWNQNQALPHGRPDSDPVLAHDPTGSIHHDCPGFLLQSPSRVADCHSRIRDTGQTNFVSGKIRGNVTFLDLILTFLGTRSTRNFFRKTSNIFRNSFWTITVHSGRFHGTYINSTGRNRRIPPFLHFCFCPGRLGMGLPKQ